MGELKCNPNPAGDWLIAWTIPKSQKGVFFYAISLSIYSILMSPWLGQRRLRNIYMFSVNPESSDTLLAGSSGISRIYTTIFPPTPLLRIKKKWVNFLEASKRTMEIHENVFYNNCLFFLDLTFEILFGQLFCNMHHPRHDTAKKRGASLCAINMLEITVTSFSNHILLLKRKKNWTDR